MFGWAVLSSFGVRARKPSASVWRRSNHSLVASSRRPAAFSMFGLLRAGEACRSNKLLQVTFDPLPTFAAAKAGAASNAPEPRRWAA